MDWTKQLIVKALLLMIIVSLGSSRSVYRYEEYDSLESCSKRIPEEKSVPLHEECTFTSSCKRSNKFAECTFKSPNYCICEIPLEIQERIGNTDEEDWMETPCDYEWHYHNNSCFLTELVQMTRTQADYFCKSEREGSNLASVHSVEEIEYLYQTHATGIHMFWIGLYDMYEHWRNVIRNFQWDDQTAFDAKLWLVEPMYMEPENDMENEWCVVMEPKSRMAFQTKQCRDKRWNVPLCRYFLDKQVSLTAEHEYRSATLCNPAISKDKRSSLHEECSFSSNCEMLQECVYKEPNYCRCEIAKRHSEEYIDDEEEDTLMEEEEEAMDVLSIDNPKTSSPEPSGRSCSSNIPEDLAVPLGEECSFTSNCRATNNMADCLYQSPNYCVCLITADVENRAWKEFRGTHFITPELQMKYMRLNSLYKSCPDRWTQYGRLCYSIDRYRVPYIMQRKLCRMKGEGIDMATVNSIETHEYLSLFIDQYFRPLLGLRDRLFMMSANTFHFAYDDGARLIYVEWRKREPFNEEYYQNCAQLIFYDVQAVYAESCDWNTNSDVFCTYYTDPVERIPTY